MFFCYKLICNTYCNYPNSPENASPGTELPAGPVLTWGHKDKWLPSLEAVLRGILAKVVCPWKLKNTDFLWRFMENPWGDADRCSRYTTDIFFCRLPKHAATDGALLSTLNWVTLRQKHLHIADELSKHFCTFKVSQHITDVCSEVVQAV